MFSRSILVGLVVLPVTAARQQAPSAIPSLSEPSISPDRSEIAFASGGDIWVVPARGGQAHLLVTNAATEARPRYSPDGRRLAFTSTRNGNADIYVLELASGELRRITYDDVAESLDNWSADGRWIYFSSSSRDISGMNDLWRVSVEGGTPMQVSADRYATEYWGAPSKDGSAIAFSARGNTAGQWWRHGHSHLDESEIWIMRDASPRSGQSAPAYARVGESGGGKDMWPMWSADGASLFYVSDRSGAENLWVRPVSGGTATKLTSFTTGRLLWPSMSADGKTIVFERDFQVWSYDVDAKRAAQVPITLRGVAASPATEHLTLSTGIQGMALSPDARKLAYIVRGEIFAMSARESGPGTRVTETPGAESQIAWAPDSRRIVYASDRNGGQNLYLFDFGTRTETQLTRGALNDITPRFSPDGNSIAYLHGLRELHVLDVATKTSRLVARGYFDRPPFVSQRLFTWSPDGRWIAYIDTEAGGFSNAYVVPAAGGEPRPVSFVPNANSGALSWSTDGTFLIIQSAQRTEPNILTRVDLIPRTPRFREDRFRDLFGPTPPPPARDSTATSARPATTDSASTPPRGARRPTQIVFDGIRLRASLISTGIDPASHVLSPDGKTLLIVGSAAGQTNLYTWSVDDAATEAPVLRQITSTAGGKSQFQWSPDSREVWYVEGGRISTVNVESRATRSLGYSAELDVDWSAEKMKVFEQGWTYLRDNFFDAKFNGVNWEEARTHYAPYIAGARTGDEMRRIMSLMVGELNASHLGVTGPGSPANVGKIGARFDRAEYESSGRLKLSEIIPLSPLAVAGGRAGEIITAIDGTPITARTNVDQLLAYRIGKQTTITLSNGTASRDVMVKPVNTGTEKGLLYRAWVESRRAYVARASNNRLGYVHMIDMGQPSLDQLIMDLDTENRSKEGVVIDVRNNNGGFVNGYAIDVLARRGYMGMTPRDLPAGSSRTALGQRALELPTVLVVNQHTLSDGEDFTEGYRAHGLGKVVGEPTAGWIIFTSNVGLLDGQTTIRLPSTRITDASGKDMEMAPRPVDVQVQRPIGEGLDRDSQLDVAVRELLATIARRPR